MISCDLLLTANRKIDYTSEEARLNALFDQPAQESDPVSIMSPVDTLAKSLAEKSQTSNLTAPTSDQGKFCSPCRCVCVYVFMCVCVCVCAHARVRTWVCVVCLCVYVI